MKICVIGTGYVGLVTGACFADFGVDVTCVDKDEAKVAALGGGEIPFYEPGLREVVERNERAGRLRFTTDLEAAVKESLVIFIAVGTPPREDGTADLTFIEEVARSISENLNGYKVIATKSTVPVGTGDLVRKIIEEGDHGASEFAVVSNPEFLREGSAVGDFMRPDRVVLGVDCERAEGILKDLYSPLYLIETPFVITTVETAELIKYASNAFLATKISFINEIANISELIGADVHTVAKAMGLDGRIGSKFLHPGPGYGGSCFPKDTSAITHIARKLDYEFKIVDAVIEVNKRQRELMVEKVRRLVGGIGGSGGGLAGKTLAVLGLTFKPNTDDIRDSPAIDVIGLLMEEGASIRAFDPEGMENAKGEVFGAITYCADSYEAAKGSDALIVLTEWNQFRKLDLGRIKDLLASPKVADLRNVYDPIHMAELGFEYTSVGRSRT